MGLLILVIFDFMFIPVRLYAITEHFLLRNISIAFFILFVFLAARLGIYNLKDYCTSINKDL
jgi:ABC-type maltose transport system permease subunit